MLFLFILKEVTLFIEPTLFSVSLNEIEYPQYSFRSITYPLSNCGYVLRIPKGLVNCPFLAVSDTDGLFIF